MNLKLGKREAQFDHRDLLMAKYLDMSKLPPIPDRFGHENLISNWGMLGNADAGDCVFAGAAHETMLWTAEGDPATALFDDDSVLSDYSAVTGYKASDPNTDQGTDMHDAMKYRRNVGVLDASGKRHKISAYIWLEPGNIDHLLAATYLFGAVGVGIQFPNSAMSQFNAGIPWSVVGGARIVGGHYVPCIANRNNLLIVSWGKIQEMTRGFFQKYCDEAVAMLSLEALIATGPLKTIDGFNITELVKDIGLLKG